MDIFSNWLKTNYEGEYDRELEVLDESRPAKRWIQSLYSDLAPPTGDKSILAAQSPYAAQTDDGVVKGKPKEDTEAKKSEELKMRDWEKLAGLTTIDPGTSTTGGEVVISGRRAEDK